MPTVSRFFGIRIDIYDQDHAPPHVHARYGEHDISIGIADLSVLGGALPRRALSMVLEWAFLHRRALLEDWELARHGRPLNTIPPLEKTGGHEMPRLRIAAVRLLAERRVELTLTNGSTKEVDLAPLLQGPIFDEIREQDDAFATVRVDPEVGTLVWPNGADICPDVLVQGLPPA